MAEIDFAYFNYEHSGLIDGPRPHPDPALAGDKNDCWGAPESSD
jgi:hypothetical protein